MKLYSASNVPLESDVALLNSFHVEAYCRDRARRERKSCQDSLVLTKAERSTYSIVNSPP